jgi:tetratricopeptide (TPR) repeat protein
MASTSELLAQALAHHQAGQLQEAEMVYRQIVAADANNAEAWHLLGVIAYQKRDYATAADCGKRAVAIRHDFPEALNNLGLVSHASGNFEEAAECFRRGLTFWRDSAELHFNLGNTLFANGAFDSAAATYQRAIQLRPEHSLAHTNLGNTFRKLGNLSDAIACYRRAVELDSASAIAYYNLGVALKEQGNLDQAASCFNQALARNPSLPDAWNALGGALVDLGKAADAAACFQRGIELQPQNPHAYNDLGAALEECGDLESAMASYRRSLELQPDLVEGYNNLGLAYFKSGEFEAAADNWRRALAIRPDAAEVHFNQSCLWLLTGDLQRGWTEYEWRWKRKDHATMPLQRSLWNGEDLAGKTIVLHAEQGLGDTIQFIRFAGVLKSKGARVVFRCQPRLCKLIATCGDIDELIAEGDDVPPFDFHAPLLSVPRIVGTTLDTIPRVVPYLAAEPALLEHWHERLEHVRGLRVGINWKGRGGRAFSRQRDIPLTLLASLSSITGTSLISLQKGVDPDELAALQDFGILNPGELDISSGAFIDTAAIIENVDLVISSDTAIAHLAGALGVPVWLALPFVPDWRWLLDRSDSPWYPTMRLFRQRQPGDWADIFEEIRQALGDYVERRPKAQAR